MNDTKEQRVWSMWQILFASYLAGPVAGCFFLSKNAETFGNKALGRKLLLIGIASTIVLGSIMLALPSAFFERSPPMILPIISGSAVYAYAVAAQKNSITELIKKGGRRHSFLRFVLLTLLLLLGTLALGMTIGFVSSFLF